ncbi:MAG: acyl-CoA dehydrogenase, partial [Enterobacteriaceae bacterium]
MTFITIMLFIGLLSCLYYYQLNLFLSVALLALYLLLMGWMGHWSYWLLLPFVAITAPLVILPWRRRFFSDPVMGWLQQHSPSISATEQVAIDAGTLWWEQTLFTGRPDWQQLQAFPLAKLTAEEQAFLQGPVEQLCLMINDFAISHTLADLPPNLWEFLRKERFFAMNIPHHYGGLAFSPYAQAQVLQKLSGMSIIVGCTVSVPNSLGPAELLLHYGTPEQKEHYLPRLASGEEIPCFALTSPEAGSDASAIPDRGTLCTEVWQGKEQLGIRLSWNKRYITLAPVATLIGLAFKLYDPEHLLGDQEALGITCALIPANHPGVERGNRHFPLNLPFMNGPTRGNNVFIPVDFIIGGPKMAGQGWRMLMECLASARGISLPAITCGSLKNIALGISAYARIRRQFKSPIGMMEGLEAPLAAIGGNAYMLDAAGTLLTSALAQGEKPATLCSIVKYHSTQRSRQAVAHAM